MGLDIYPGRAQWSYGGFSHFRSRLAEAEGIVLAEMQGYGGAREWETSNGDYITPLAPLLNHSDCDGYLEPHECELIVPRLRHIVSQWPESDWDRQQAERLIEGMEHSAEHGCAVRFR